MYQILKKLFLVFLCLSLLSSFVFADDLTILEGENFNTFGSLSAADYGVKSVSYSASFVFLIPYGSSYTLSVNSDSTSDSVSATVNSAVVKCKSATVVMPAGTLDLTFFAPVASCSTSVSGVTVSKSGSSVTIVSDGSQSPIALSLTFSRTSSTSLSVSSSFTPSSSGGGDTPVDPSDPYAGTGSMFGWTGETLFTLRFLDQEHWYIDGSSSGRVGHLDVVVGTTEAELPGYYARTKLLAALTYQKWKWSIDQETGLPKFSVLPEQEGSWADMLYRTSVYNYFWGNKLWNNDVSGSWYSSISSDFSYLNFRVNQILSVLANDEDLAIKDATTSERDWVKNYFNGSGDKADSSKYDDLNNTGSAFKDAFAGAPDSTIADGFTAVNDNGYEFWSQGVSDDINGVSSSGYSRAPAYVPPDQRIVDAYSENWAQIVGGYYD